MIALWKALPLLYQLAAIAAGLTAIGGGIALWKHSLIAEGEERRQTKIDIQNQGAKNAADEADLPVDACYAAGRVWNDKAGECRGPDSGD